MRRIKILIVLFFVTTSSFANCTNEEKQQLKNDGYTDNQVSDICTSSVMIDKNTTLGQYNPYIMLRVGYKFITGTYTVRSEQDPLRGDEQERGFEALFISGQNYPNKFGWSSGFGLVFENGSFNAGVNIVDTSSILVVGELEAAYNISEYVVPYLGFNGGIGRQIYSVDSTNYDENGRASQLGVFVGFKGDLTDHIGYYLKVSAISRLDKYVRHTLVDTAFGLSYKF